MDKEIAEEVGTKLVKANTGGLEIILQHIEGAELGGKQDHEQDDFGFLAESVEIGPVSDVCSDRDTAVQRDVHWKVFFYDGTTLLRSLALSGAAAKFTALDAGPGTHTIMGTFKGSTSFFGSSAMLMQTAN